MHIWATRLQICIPSYGRATGAFAPASHERCRFAGTSWKVTVVGVFHNKRTSEKVVIAIKSSGKNINLSHFSAFYTVSIIRARLITRISIEVEVRYSQFILFHGRLTGNKTA